MIRNPKKGSTYNPVPPPVSRFNEDVRANEIMKAFNDMKDKRRMEVTSLFDLNTFPSSIPKIRK
jgi:hypothetical protein